MLSLLLALAINAAAAGAKVDPTSLPVISSSSQTVAATSVVVFAANANRKYIECWTLCTNTDWIAFKWGEAAVTTDTPLEQCSYWSTPEIFVSTLSFNAIAVSGSQVIRCLSY